MKLTYTMEIFAPGQDMSKDPPQYGVIGGTGNEARMALVQVN